MAMGRQARQKFFYKECKALNYEHWLLDDAILQTELLALAVIGLLVFLDKRKKARANKARRLFLRRWNIHV